MERRSCFRSNHLVASWSHTARNSVLIVHMVIRTTFKLLRNIQREYPLNRTLGHSLSALGNAHIKVATLQEQFGEQLNSMFLTRLELSLAEVAQYYVLRKKLKSRRLGAAPFDDMN